MLSIVRSRKIGLSALLGAALLSTLASCDRPVTAQEQGAPAESAPAPTVSGAIAQLVERLAPAVVEVHGATMGTYHSVVVEGDLKTSGFIVRDDGYIVTAYRSIDDATSIRVTLHDGSEYSATVIGGDEMFNLAVLRIETESPLVALPLGDSDELAVGEWVVALGRPRDAAIAANAGIVSMLSRDDVGTRIRYSYDRFIQTNAWVEGGYEGGPLVDLEGNVVGLTMVPERVYPSAGFAIPINVVEAVIRQLVEHGVFQPSCVGVRIQPVGPAQVVDLGLERSVGAMVTHVEEGGPGEASGIEPGDVIVRFGDAPIELADDLAWRSRVAGPGTTVEVTVLRAGEELTVPVTLGAIPCGRSSEPAEAGERDGGFADGLVVTAVDAETAALTGVPEGSGVRVDEIRGEALLAPSGLRVGDVIVEANNVPVTSVGQFFALMASIDRGEVVRFRIKRRHAWVFLAVRY